MKRSSMLLLALVFVFISGLLYTDYLLAIAYTKIDLKDPFKNFQHVAVQPFKAIRISGGNGYTIRLIRGDSFTIRLLNSRKSFFKMKRSADTLSIDFGVANQTYQHPKAATVGLIITMPRIDHIQLSGTNNEVAAFIQDSLTLVQDKQTFTRVNNVNLHYLQLLGVGKSYLDFESENNVTSLDMNMKNSTITDFHQVIVGNFNPVLLDSAGIVLYGQSLNNLR